MFVAGPVGFEPTTSGYPPIVVRRLPRGACVSPQRHNPG